MTEQLANGVEIDPSHDEFAGECVPQIMKSERGDLCLLEYARPRFPRLGQAIFRRAAHEDEAVQISGGCRPRLEHLRRIRVERQMASLAGLCVQASNGQQFLRMIDVTPTKVQKLTPTKPGIQRDEVLTASGSRYTCRIRATHHSRVPRATYSPKHVLRGERRLERPGPFERALLPHRKGSARPPIRLRTSVSYDSRDDSRASPIRRREPALLVAPRCLG